MPSNVCEVCGGLFPPITWGGNQKRYCSDRCGRKAWRLRHSEEISSRQRRWRKDHIDRHRNANRTYQDRHRDLVNKRNREYEARLSALTADERRVKREAKKQRTQSLARVRALFTATYWWARNKKGFPPEWVNPVKDLVVQQELTYEQGTAFIRELAFALKGMMNDG